MEQIPIKTNRIIYDLCGGSGSWSKPYSDAGYIVRVVDPINGGGDVRLLEAPQEKIYGILAAPPCTHFARVGNRYWKMKDRNGQTFEGLAILDACIRFIFLARPFFWSLEHPTGRTYKYIGQPVMSFHPYEYGDPYKKLTHLWGRFNLPKKNIVKPIKVKSNENSIDRYILDIKNEKLTKDGRGTLRSVTPPGFARAFFEANQ